MTAHHRLRTIFYNAILVTAMAWSPRPAVAEDSKAPIYRVRSSDPSIRALIGQATTQSPTFKRLVATVEASDGIIYVEFGSCRERLAACLPLWMTSSGGNRFMGIVVDRKRIDSDWKLLGSIGHELQHAIEALSDRFVTNSLKMYFFFRRYAPTERTRFETLDATNAGAAVERELRAWRRDAKSLLPDP
jgi:hypothetical protein